MAHNSSLSIVSDLFPSFLQNYAYLIQHKGNQNDDTVNHDNRIGTMFEVWLTVAITTAANREKPMVTGR